ncbi:MAG: arginase family protein [Chloroflexota bacterium]|nr:arginase family protein [Chloroflexota bacterium]MDE3192155.1 arginase family protein [Chloroflexota bacterium]
MAEAPAALAPEMAAALRPGKRVRIPFLPRDRYLTAARESCRTLSDAVASSLGEGARCAIVGGECTLVAGSIPGALAVEPDLALVYFDAHADFNTLATTPSHFVGGMCLAHVCGRKIAPLLWPGVRSIPDDRVALVGARALDPGEVGVLAASKVRRIAFDADRPDAPGLVAFARRKQLWIHVDVDVVDPRELPAVDFPVEGGPSLRALVDVLASLAAAATVRGIEVCCYDPRKDNGPRPVAPSLARIPAAALGLGALV